MKFALEVANLKAIKYRLLDHSDIRITSWNIAMAPPALIADPVYMKHVQVNFVGGNINNVIRNAVNKSVKDSHAAVCIQLLNGMWHLYVKTPEMRVKLLTNGLMIGCTAIMLYDDNPWTNNNGESMSMKIVIRDAPFTMDNKEITSYFHAHHPQVVLKSNVLYSKIRDETDDLTSTYNGDRYFYCQAGFSPALPKTAQIAGEKCRIWHRDQKNMCQRCSQMGHITSDIDKCAAYADPGTQNLVVFESKSNPLCNFYNDGEGFNMDDIHFLTAEHGYQYLKCRHLGCQEIAEEVLNAPTPGAAKKRANKVP